MTTSGSMKHLNLVSIKPAAAQLSRRRANSFRARTECNSERNAHELNLMYRSPSVQIGRGTLRM
jgi:hypothetical protein